MNSEDQILMENAYNEVVKQQLIDEGLWDRIKAGTSGIAAGAGAALGNVGKVVKAGGQGIMGKGAEAKKTIASVKDVGAAAGTAKAKSFVKGTGAKLASEIDEAVKALVKIQPIMDDFIKDTANTVNINPTIAKNLNSMNTRITGIISDLKAIANATQMQQSYQK